MNFQVDWQVLGLVALTILSPTLTGFLREFNTKFSETGAWWAKSAVSSAIGTLLGMIAAWQAQGDMLLGAAGGALIGGFGAVNIAFRKGPSKVFSADVIPRGVTPPVPPTT